MTKRKPLRPVLLATVIGVLYGGQPLNEADEQWLVNTSRDFMRPFVESLRERADGSPIADLGWATFFTWLDTPGAVTIPWLATWSLPIPADVGGYLERLEIARRMALNHINSDLRRALMAHGIGDDALWRCVGRQVDDCQRKIVGGMAIGGDFLALFWSEFDVQEIRDDVREKVFDALVNERILRCCDET